MNMQLIITRKRLHVCVHRDFFPPPVFNLWSVFLGSTGGLSFRRLLDIRVLFFVSLSNIETNLTAISLILLLLSFVCALVWGPRLLHSNLS